MRNCILIASMVVLASFIFLIVWIVMRDKASEEVEFAIYEDTYKDHTYIIFIFPETNQFSVIHSPDCICNGN